MVLYGSITLISISELIALGQTYILLLAIPAIPVFAWHLWLVSKRDERKKAGIEILATGVLALAAPAAFWIGKEAYQPAGWWLWILVWFQSSASIIYAYLRLEQRLWQSTPEPVSRFKFGWRAICYTQANLFLSFGLGVFKIIPGWVWLAFLLQTVETLWGALNPAIGAKPVAIGVRQLIISTLFTILFILTWR